MNNQRPFSLLLGFCMLAPLALAQPAPALRPPDVKFTTMTMQTSVLVDAVTTSTVPDWSHVELLIPEATNVRPGSHSGHWSCTPGTVEVRLEVPANLRPQVAGVVFWSRWADSEIESPITFHTQRFRKISDRQAGPRRGQRPGQDATPQPAARAMRPLIVDALFTAPVHGDYHLYVEIVDHNGARHLSPTIVLNCAAELPPEPKAQPITDTKPRLP